MNYDNITEQDRQNLFNAYKDVEQGISETIERMRPHLRAKMLIIPFEGGRAFYDRREDRVTKIKTSKLINPECIHTEDEPIYEYVEVLF